MYLKKEDVGNNAGVFISCFPRNIYPCNNHGSLLIGDNTGSHGNDQLPKPWSSVAKKILENIGWNGGHSKFILSHPEVKCVQVGQVRVGSSHSLFDLPRGGQVVTTSPELRQARAGLCYCHQHGHGQRVALDSKGGKEGAPCL